MYLVVGLGNPGPRYAGTRHNLGFQVVEALSRELKAERPVQIKRALCVKAVVDSKGFILAQPLSYMNRSGGPVSELLLYYKLEPERLVLIYDDLDLPPGSIRLRYGGGSGGHRGVVSVIEQLETRDFVRLRLGIGRSYPGMNASHYVLEPLEKEEREYLEQGIKQASLAVQCLVREGLEAAMNKYNRPLQE